MHLIHGDVAGARVVAVLVHHLPTYAAQVSGLADAGVLLTDDADAFFACGADLVLEAAGQDAVGQYGLRVLGAGVHFLVASIGAFTDEALYAALIECAENHAANLYLVAGALPAVDWMQGASNAEVYSVKITQIKPVASWQNTPAENMVNLDELTVRTCFFEGSARQAAGLFRKSSNITALLALATVGLDRTKVALMADPTGSAMETMIAFNGEAGDLTVKWHGVPSAINPSTSKDVPLNVIKALRNICSPVKLGV